VLSEIMNGKKRQSQEAHLEQLFASRERREKRTVEVLYLAAVEDRVNEITGRLRVEIAEELRTAFNDELEIRVAAIRSHYEALLQQNGKMPDATPELLEEIAATHAQLMQKEVELARGLSDESFPYGNILRLRSECLQLESYLRGLNYRVKILQNQE